MNPQYLLSLQILITLSLPLNYLDIKMLDIKIRFRPPTF